MTEVTNELMFEVLKAIQDRVVKSDDKLAEISLELKAIRGHMLATQQDIANIYATLGRHGERLDRIERRLELAEVH